MRLELVVHESSSQPPNRGAEAYTAYKSTSSSRATRNEASRLTKQYPNTAFWLYQMSVLGFSCPTWSEVGRENSVSNIEKHRKSRMRFLARSALRWSGMSGSEAVTSKMPSERHVP